MLGLLLLMTVQESFVLQRGVTVLTPTFRHPASGWRHRVERVLLVSPSGQERTVEASIESQHFLLQDPLESDARSWQIVISLLCQSRVEPGTRILASPRLVEELGSSASRD